MLWYSTPGHPATKRNHYANNATVSGLTVGNDQTRCWAVPPLLRLLYLDSIHSKNQLLVVTKANKYHYDTRGVILHEMCSSRCAFSLALGWQGKKWCERTRPTSASSFVASYLHTTAHGNLIKPFPTESQILGFSESSELGLVYPMYAPPVSRNLYSNAMSVSGWR